MQYVLGLPLNLGARTAAFLGFVLVIVGLAGPPAGLNVSLRNGTSHYDLALRTSAALPLGAPLPEMTSAGVVTPPAPCVTRTRGEKGPSGRGCGGHFFFGVKTAASPIPGEDHWSGTFTSSSPVGWNGPTQTRRPDDSVSRHRSRTVSGGRPVTRAVSAR